MHAPCQGCRARPVGSRVDQWPRVTIPATADISRRMAGTQKMVMLMASYAEQMPRENYDLIVKYKAGLMAAPPGGMMGAGAPTE